MFFGIFGVAVESTMAVGGWRMRRLLTGALLLLGGLCSTHADDQQEVWLVELLPRVHAAQLPAWPTTRVTSRAERREQVAAFLQATVEPTQRHAERVLRRYAEESNAADAVTVERLWIQNTLLVRWRRGRGDAQTTMKRLQWLPGVHSLERDAPSGLSLLPVTTDNEEEEGRHRADQREAVQTNVRLVHAPEVWDQVKARGDGVTVASIDSGVRYTHEALATTFRGYRGASNVTFDYSFWFKPGTDPSKETPDTADEVGHGTHTVGTAVGGRGIGVAPGATWIAARAFDIHGAVSHSDFLLATQWALCPTKVDGSAKNCSLGADVITGSFGVDRSDVATFKQWTWLTHALQVWRSAGSYAVFASGNANGFKCGSVFYPASRPESVAVGALIGGSTLWGASGKGPGADDESDSGDVVKPDFVAPGAAIRSALSTGDSAYTRMTGTSMAAPHLTGLIALLLSIQQPHNKPCDVVKVLQETASHGLSKPFLVPSTCGGTRYDQYPNNIYGSGLPNVCNAATKAFSVACHSTKTAMDTVVSVE